MDIQLIIFIVGNLAILGAVVYTRPIVTAAAAAAYAAAMCASIMADYPLDVGTVLMAAGCVAIVSVVAYFAHAFVLKTPIRNRT